MQSVGEINANRNYRINISPGILVSCAYILFSYIANGTFLNVNYSRLSLYLFIAWAVFQAIKQRNSVVTHYTIWYYCFIFICVVSLVYAKYQTYAIDGIYALMVVFALNLAFSVVIDKETDIITIIWTYSLSATILFLLLYISGNLYSEERLGAALTGNANIFATMYMVSAMCSVWLFIHYKKAKRVIALLAFLSQLYALVLSGGRKYIIIPFLFLYMVLLLRRDPKGKRHMIKYTLIFICISVIIYWSFFNVQIFYDTLGHRIETLLNFFKGTGRVDDSTLVRHNMIISGLDIWNKSPVWGVGINNFAGYYGKMTGKYVYSHNNYIEVLADLGIIGFVTYYFFYFWILIKLAKLKEDEFGLRNFFIAFVFCLFPFEIGAVSYNILIIHIFLALSSIYITKKTRRVEESAK